MEIKDVLVGVENGSISVEEALLKLKMKPFEDLGFAKLDYHRSLRQGAAEVIYGASKTSLQMIKIIESMLENGQERILITKLSSEAADEIKKVHDIKYYDIAKLGIIGGFPEPNGRGKIVIATGGTSDMPIAEEAALTAQMYGNEVVRIYDVGVAGIHRLLSYKEELMSASVVIAVAGMEGALASVVGGLVDCPVIGVPTSVGYGTALGGMTALFSMLNSCSSGVSVVNIDNGFGAGYLANRINHV